MRIPIPLNLTETFETMNTTHSPRPWTIELNDTVGIFNGSYQVTCPDEHWPNDYDERNVVCRLPTGTQGTYLANARLIASAPELLAACQDALRALELRADRQDPNITEDILRLAIAKATGN